MDELERLIARYARHGLGVSELTQMVNLLLKEREAMPMLMSVAGAKSGLLPTSGGATQ